MYYFEIERLILAPMPGVIDGSLLSNWKVALYPVDAFGAALVGLGAVSTETTVAANCLLLP